MSLHQLKWISASEMSFVFFFLVIKVDQESLSTIFVSLKFLGVVLIWGKIWLYPSMSWFLLFCLVDWVWVNLLLSLTFLSTCIPLFFFCTTIFYFCLTIWKPFTILIILFFNYQIASNFSFMFSFILLRAI